ncbi:MAG: hypothetical protein IKB23_05545 [Clostridia bacterium]|nr:hypothetical protein [Clostridia bacterium]
MKRFIRIIVLLLAVCQIACCFSGCKKEQEETVQEPAFDLTREQLAEYKIVVPDGNADMKAAATTLQGIIEKAVGAKLEIKTDKVVEGSDTQCETEYEILIGFVNRAEAREFYSSVKNKDVGYALVGKKLLMLGHDLSCVNSSVMQFKMNVLDKVSSGVLLNAGDKNVTAGEYEYDTFTLNGVDIGKYRIVYSQWSDHGEYEAASNLKNWIIDKTGYVLECVSDNTEPCEYEINIGDTTRISNDMKSQRASNGYENGKSYIGVSDKTVWISGGNSSLLHQATTQFIKSAKYADKNITLNIEKSACVTFSGEFSLSVMNYNVYHDLSESKRNPNDVLVSVKQKNPDVFGLNEAGRDWINKFKNDSEISAKYACAEGKALENSSDSSYNPVFYNKDRFELIESDTKWLSKTPDKMSMDIDAKHYKGLTYVILKEKASGTEFMYINTHLDGSNESDAHAALKEVRKRQAEIVKSFAAKYPFMPIVIGGDFNEGPASSVIGGMSRNTRFRYCMDVADTKVNINSTDVNSNYDAISDGVIFDYLFVSADCVSVKKYEQWDNKISGKYPSDHLPVYAELTVKY